MSTNATDQIDTAIQALRRAVLTAHDEGTARGRTKAREQARREIEAEYRTMQDELNRLLWMALDEARRSLPWWDGGEHTTDPQRLRTEYRLLSLEIGDNGGAEVPADLLSLIEEVAGTRGRMNGLAAALRILRGVSKGKEETR